MCLCLCLCVCVYTEITHTSNHTSNKNTAQESPHYSLLWTGGRGADLSGRGRTPRPHVSLEVAPAVEAVHHLHADPADRPLPVAGQRSVPDHPAPLDAGPAGGVAAAAADWSPGAGGVRVRLLPLEAVLC